MTTPTANALTAKASPAKASPVRRIARVAGGWALLAVGTALLVLPGPGLLVIAAGLALLATEYEWAARLLRKVKARLAAAKDRLTSSTKGDDS